ncbi:MAG: 5-methylthioadenosine phosphorylase [Miltoncostaeaceae bacterium]|nr:5-methylthioadenosine phosphorylase [Miltoncostaeaceae bacterium]
MIGVITGTGGHALPGLERVVARGIATRHGTAEVTLGRVAGVEVAHLSRHGVGHERLSHQVEHRAAIAAFAALGVAGAVATTVCGAVDPDLPLGGLVVFDDLHFPANRLPDGSACTLFTEPGERGRGHWIFDRPFAAPVREALLASARACGRPVRDGGTYGHVDGPRLNSRSEVRALAAAGVAAISQTGGPETVLAGEAEIPFALLGFVTDHANGVRGQPTPVAALARLLSESGGICAEVLAAALPAIAAAPRRPAGFVYRFDP